MAMGKLAEKTSPVIAPKNGRKRKIRTMVQTPWGPQMAKKIFVRHIIHNNCNYAIIFEGRNDYEELEKSSMA